jgi:hypothetical protein
MWQKILDLLKAPAFPDDEENKRCAHALNALHLNMGGAMFGLGILGVMFFFLEKILSSIILGLGILVTLIGMTLNRGKGQHFISPCHPQILKEYYER